MRRDDRRYESGLVERVWVAECRSCGMQFAVHSQVHARAWEAAHHRAGCGHALVPDESGRGWLPARV